MRFCRDERCDRIGLHLKHKLSGRREPDYEESKSTRTPWQRPAPRALDHSIAKAVSKTYPKSLDLILNDVVHDYGDCCMRTVQRRLKRLVERGHILRIDLGQRLYAYIRPGSNMISEVDLMREQIETLMMAAAA